MTFPFPTDIWNHELTMLASIGNRYHGSRASVMHNRQEGLTKIYNRFHDPKEGDRNICSLRDLHVEMDIAVAAAYGWEDIALGHGSRLTKQGERFTISEAAQREVLQRLLKLNHERYAEEVKQGLHDKKGKAKKADASKRRKKADDSQGLFGDEDDEGG